jgi:hypothetical protein
MCSRLLTTSRRLSQVIRDDITSMQNEVRQISNSVAELQLRIQGIEPNHLGYPFAHFATDAL